MRTTVYFGIDTETSMGCAWREEQRRPLEVARTMFCRTGDGDCGLPSIASLLGSHGFRATFFVEMFCSDSLGDAALRHVTEFLLHKGQDVQLHLHPTFHYYGGAALSDHLCAYTVRPKLALGSSWTD